jgi:hypothetical protein
MLSSEYYFGSKREAVIRSERKLHNARFHNLNSANIFRHVINEAEIRGVITWAGWMRNE